MSKKILVFAGSTSSNSINKKLAKFAAENLEQNTFTLIDLRDFNLPLYSIDREGEGFPDNADRFSNLLDSHDGFIVSLAEHNGSYTAAFKNIFDWSSRIKKNVFRDKPLLLMATSPGARGGATVLNTASLSFPHMGAKSIVTFSLPSFNANFNEGRITNEDYLNLLKEKIKDFEGNLK